MRRELLSQPDGSMSFTTTYFSKTLAYAILGYYRAARNLSK